MKPIEQPKVLVIAGPTASGKTALSLEFARRLQLAGQRCEIVVADSIAHYAGFDIGAAKPTSAEQAEVPHHLLNVCRGGDEFTAGDFVRHANSIINRLLAASVQPIVVGGSGFYLRALLQGMAVDEDPGKKRQVRSQLEETEAELGLVALYERMVALDPELKEKIHANDRYRVLRALEAMELSGKPWSQLNREAQSREPRWPHNYFCLNSTWEDLEARIEARASAMLRAGLLQEVQNLLAAGISPSAKPFQSVGYRQCLEYLNLCEPPLGHHRALTEAELVRAIAQATRRLARSQLTWFKGQAPHAIWLRCGEEENRNVEKIYRHCFGEVGN